MFIAFLLKIAAGLGVLILALAAWMIYENRRYPLCNICKHNLCPRRSKLHGKFVD